jgi:hypothetical protein
MGRRTLCMCQGCGKSIIWCTTESGKMMPVDWKPELEMVEKFDPKTMTSHFATCPRSGDFRKKKEKKQ